MRGTPQNDTICGRCLEGKGWYKSRDGHINLVCSFYEDVFIPKYLERLRNERNVEYVKRQMRPRNSQERGEAGS